MHSSCPSCKMALKTGGLAPGKHVRCPGCNTVFALGAPAVPAPAPPPRVPAPAPPSPPAARAPAPPKKEVSGADWDRALASAGVPQKKRQAGPPPSFKVRIKLAWSTNQLFRVYVLDDELIFIYRGLDGALTRTIAGQFGFLGWIFGKFVGSRQDRVADQDDPRHPEEQLDSIPKSYRVSPDDLLDVRLDRKSFFKLFFYRRRGKFAGLFRFRHRNKGKFTCEILTYEDLRVAQDHLPRLFGDRITVRV